MKTNQLGIIALTFILSGCASESGSKQATSAADEVAAVTDRPEESVTENLPEEELAQVTKDVETSEVNQDVSAEEKPDVEVDAGPIPIENSPIKVWKVEEASQLVSGVGAEARVGGAWVVENGAARFYIQDTGVGTGYNLYGGNVIDASLVYSDGTTGPDLFRETFPLVAFKVPTADIIETKTGDDGHPVLMVRGTDAYSNVIDILDSLVMGPANLEIETEYGMLPDIPALRITTRVRWPEGAQKSVLLFGDLLAFGRYQNMFTQEGGYDNPIELSNLTSVVTRAKGASYGMFQQTGNFSFLAEDAGNTALVYNDLPEEDENGWITVERWLAVGDGSPASVFEVRDMLQDNDVVKITGNVRDWGDGSYVDGAVVTALRMTAEGPVAVNQDITDETGEFRMTLTPGQELQFLASSRDRDRSELLFMVVDENLDLELEVSPPAVIRFDTDGPTRASLKGIDVVPMDGFLGESKQGGHERRLYSHSGKESFTVRPGTYEITVSRGPEFSVSRSTVTVVAGQELVLDQSPIREVESPGWVSGDFHQHTEKSLDSNMPVRTKLIENLVEGVEVAVVTDHNNLADYGPYAEELGVTDLVHTMVGMEVSYTSIGHFNAFPLAMGGDNPFAMIGAQFWSKKGPHIMMDDVLELFPEALIQVNHPRDDLDGYYSWLDMDPLTGEERAEGRVLSKTPVAVEVNEKFVLPEMLGDEGEELLLSLSPYEIPAMMDWLNLVESGYPITGMANSDSHNYGSGTGYPRTYLYVGDDDNLSTMTDKVVTDAIREQRAVMSQGILAWPEVQGEVRLGTKQSVKVAEDGTVEVVLQIRAPSWVKVGGVTVLKGKKPVEVSYLNGKLYPYDDGTVDWVSFDQVDGEPLATSLTYVFSPEESTHYIFNVYGESNEGQIYGGYSYALTNPLYVNVP